MIIYLNFFKIKDGKKQSFFKKVMTARLLILFAAYMLVYFTLCGWILNLLNAN